MTDPRRVPIPQCTSPHRGTRTVLLALAAAGLAGCSVLGLPSIGGDDKGAVKPPPATVSQPGRKVVLVGLDQAGARVELGLDQQLQVRLLTKVAATPEWSLIGPVPAVVSVQGPRFEPDVRSNGSGEVEGDTVWQVRPTAAGSLQLRFEYRRPRSTAPATQVVTFDVVIK
jgi:predicted secreted protein